MGRKGIGNGRIWASLAVASVFVLLFIFNSPRLSRAGDVNIAGCLASDVRPGYYFISPIIAYPLHWLYLLAPKISWWVCFSVFAIWVFVFLLCFCLRGMIVGKGSRILITGAFIAAAWFGIGCTPINFTQTAAVLALSGMLLIWWDGYFAAKKRKGAQIAGAVLLILGWLVRWKAVLFCLPFAVVAGGYFFLEELAHGSCSWRTGRAAVKMFWKTNLPTWRILACSLAAVLALMGYGAVDQDWREYYQANALRESIYDYYQQYPKYDKHQVEYQKADASRSMMGMLKANMTADHKQFNSGALKKIYDLKRTDRITRKKLAEVKYVFGGNQTFIIVAALLLAAIFFFYKNSFIPVILQTGALLLCLTYLAYIGRARWRVVVCALFAYLLGCAVTAAKGRPCRRGGETAFKAFFSLSLFVICVAAGLGNYHFRVPRAGVKDASISRCLDYINAHKENVYLMADRKARYYEAHTLWDSPEVGYCDNLVMHAANFSLGQKGLLERYGKDSFFEALVGNKNVLSQYRRVLYDYLRETYYPYISVSVIDKVGKSEFVRYMKPLAVTGRKKVLPEAVPEQVDYDRKRGRLKLLFKREDSEKARYLEICALDGKLSYTFCKRSDTEENVFDIFVPEYIRENAKQIEIFLVSGLDGRYQFYKSVKIDGFHVKCTMGTQKRTYKGIHKKIHKNPEA